MMGCLISEIKVGINTGYFLSVGYIQYSRTKFQKR